MRTHTAVRQCEDGLGAVAVRVEVENAADYFRQAAGDIPRARLRSLVIDQALVDTGASMRCLPQDLVDRLRLPRLHEVDAETASGMYRTAVYEEARIRVEDRTATVECVALPKVRPLLGVIPLDQLGLEPHLANQRLRVLPEIGSGSHIRI